MAIDEGVEDAGVYCLVLRLTRSRRVEVGALGTYVFSSGWYVYTGSAKRNLNSRLTRHLLRGKRLHWHVDYLRAVASLERVWVWPWSPGMECRTNARIQALPGATIPCKGFGSSDCHCGSHLAMFPTEPQLACDGVGRQHVSLLKHLMARNLTCRGKGRILLTSARVRREKEQP